SWCCTTAAPRPRTRSSRGAVTASPATSGRARSRSSATTRCRAPRRARSCIGRCVCSWRKGKVRRGRCLRSLSPFFQGRGLGGGVWAGVDRLGEEPARRPSPRKSGERERRRSAEEEKEGNRMSTSAPVDLAAAPDSCAAWIARFLEKRGIDRIFGLQGGHIQPIWDHVARRGIRIVDVRDEGAAVHMAHAHAELTGGFGVAMVTAGARGTNTVTAMANAYLARVPVLLIGGRPPPAPGHKGPPHDTPPRRNL